MINSSRAVDLMVADWKSQGLPKAQIVVNTAKAEIGWCYVWGAVGAVCSPSKRRYYAGRDSCPDDEKAEIRRTCQVLNGSKSSCHGCKWYPNDETTLADDCQGFVKQVVSRVGIKLSGGGCTSMWKNKSNWSEYGTIDKLPEKVCCVFWTDKKDKSKKSHIGFYIGGGMMVHCSGEVKMEKLSNKCTDYAVPKGLDGDIPVEFPTLRRGDQGEYVTLMQTRLVKLGYGEMLGKFGADGKFGAKTEEAVKKFQQDNGLKVDGICGSDTWDALMDEDTTLYTVTIQHLGKKVANAIVKQYGGTMTKEGD